MPAYIQDVVRGLARPKELAYVLQQDIPLVQIERYFLQAPALGHDRSRTPAALGGGSRTTSSRQWVRRVNMSRIIRIAAGRGPVTPGWNDQSSSNSPGERAGAACGVLKRFRECTRSLTLAAEYPFRKQRGSYGAAAVRERFRQKSRKRLSTPACAILGSFQSGPYHVAWRFSFPFIQLDCKGL